MTSPTPVLTDEQIERAALDTPHNGDASDSLAWLTRFARAIETRILSAAAIAAPAGEGDETNKPGDTLEDNVRYLLDQCPHSVRDQSGERTGMRGREDLAGSLAITFLGMQHKLAELAAPAVPVPPADNWRPIKAAPRDGTNILLRFGVDGVSQGKFVPGGVLYPWKFIDTNDGITWLVNHAVDGPGGPSHWQPLPSADRAAMPSEGGKEPPTLPQSLVNLIGEYGIARTDGVTETERLHLWQLLIDGIKKYAADVAAPPSPPPADQQKEPTSSALREALGIEFNDKREFRDHWRYVFDGHLISVSRKSERDMWYFIIKRPNGSELLAEYAQGAHAFDSSSDRVLADVVRVIETERERLLFEKNLVDLYGDPLSARDRHGFYRFFTTQSAWIGWQARAAASPPPAGLGEPVAQVVAYESSKSGYTVTKAQRQSLQNPGEFNIALVRLRDLPVATPPAGVQGDGPKLAVWFGPMPESNGKTNWTAILHRTGGFSEFAEGITLARSEYHDRVRYEADRARHLIGELADEPDILAYDSGMRSPRPSGSAGAEPEGGAQPGTDGVNPSDGGQQ